MVEGAEQLDRIRQSRTSLVILAVALGGFYYASHVSLQYESYWWVYSMAYSSSVLFLIGLALAIYDWLQDTGHQSDLRQKIQAETESLRNEIDEPEEETEEPAESVNESETPQKTTWTKLLK
jgi:hypothetical protein